MNIKIRFACLFLLLTSYLVPPTYVYADAPALSSPLTEINVNEEFILHVYVMGLEPKSTHRLRIAISREGSDKYFGETISGGAWYGGSDPMNYGSFFGILTDDQGFWAGDVRGRVVNGSYNFDNGLGRHNLKVVLYSDYSGNGNWSEAYPIEIKDQNPNPPTIVPTQDPTPVPLPTDPPTPTPTVTLTPTPIVVFIIPPASGTPTQGNTPDGKNLNSADIAGVTTASDSGSFLSPEFFLIEGLIVGIITGTIFYYFKFLKKKAFRKTPPKTLQGEPSG